MVRTTNGTTGNDTINFEYVNGLFYYNGFWQWASGNDDDDLVYGKAGNDNISFIAGFDTIYGGAGDDTINSGVEEDVLYGEDGNDYLASSYGKDTLFGGAGNDTLIGDVGNGYNPSYGHDSLNGGSGKDYLYGGNGVDTLTGGGGDDTLIGARMRDFITTGGGSDEVHVHNEDNGKQDRISDFDLNNDIIGTTTAYSNIGWYYDAAFGTVIKDTSTNYHVAILDNVNYTGQLNSSHFTQI